VGVLDDDVFGVPRDEVPWVLYPVTQVRALPAEFGPDDLVRTSVGSAPQGSMPVRRLIVPHLEAMFAAARADGVVLGIVSGYRSYASQAALFDSGVRQQMALGAAREDAEARVNRFRARPGHSQHQLGTTVDLTSPEAGNALGFRFNQTRAAQWVREHAWEHGFVIPYTEDGEPYTGYANEPWHVRWVGHDLAALLAADHYLDRPTPTADDYLVALDALLSGTLGACGR
jgi:LAS superfamily LD-carboxypeptidase LdcB